jgi:4-amino-4-deoxy-L-arabinose transferase-like glycosyltransferase
MPYATTADRPALRMPATFSGRLAIIAALGGLLRVLYVLLVLADNPLSGDAAGYHHAANLFADGAGFPEPLRHMFGGVDLIVRNGAEIIVATPIGHLEPTAGHPPVWTVLLGTFSFLGAVTVLQQQVVAALLGVPAIVLVGLLGRELRSERLGLIAAGLTAGYAFVWVNDGLLMAETAAIAAAAATSWAGLRFARDPSRRRAIVFGLVGGLAALSRAELLLMLPLLTAVVLLRAPIPWRERIIRTSVAAAATLLLLAPWVIRNMLVFEEPVFLSNGAGTVLVQANCDPTYQGDFLGYWRLECGQPAPFGPAGGHLDESERDAVVLDRALDYIGDHRTRLITVVVPARIGRMWGVYDTVDQLRLDALVDRRPLAVSTLGLLQYVAIVPLAAAGAVLLWRRRESLLAVAAWVPIATLTAAISFGNTRYRTAAEVSLVVLAAVALDVLAERQRQPAQPPGGSS